LKLTGAERQQLAKRPTENLKAFQYYTQGRLYTNRRTREDLLAAIRYCEKAIEEDPNYALAYAGLSDAHINLGFRGYIAPIKDRDLDPISPMSAREVAISYYCKRDHVRALGVVRHANELGPAFSGAEEIGMYMQNRLFDEALAELDKAE